MEMIELPRPPNNSGAFIPPSQFEGKKKPHKGWKETISLPREDIETLLTQYETRTVDQILLWRLLSVRDINPALAKWLAEIRTNFLGR